MFSPDIQTGLYRVSPQGDEPRPVTNISPGEAAHRSPTFLPDGEHFLYVLLAKDEAKEREAIYLAKIDADRDTGEQSEYQGRRLLEGFSKVFYVPPIPPHSVGYLLRVVDDNLMAQPFDASRFKLTGKPRLVAESVMQGWGGATADFFASNTGNLVLSSRSAVPLNRLVWFDRRGRRLAVAGQPDRYGWVELSPDGKRVAFDLTDSGLTKGDIWVLDTVSDRRTPITSHPDFDGGPIWSPDGGSIIFHSDRDGLSNRIYRMAASGVGDAKPVTEKGGWASDWSSNGKYIIYSRVGHPTRLDLWITRLDGDPASLPYIEDEDHQILGQFSPDGKYVAYASNESGRYEIYVQTFPATDERWTISPRGGVYPRWRGDGKELFYVAPERTLMSVEIRRDPSFEAAPPTELFQTRMAAHNNRPRFDVTADGQRFLISTLVEEQPPQPLTVMLNWQARLEQ